MPELKILRRTFGYSAIVFAFIFATMLPVLLHAPLPHATARFHAEPVGLLFVAMRELILVLPPLVALVNGTAWLALTSNHFSGRLWAIAACASFLAMSVPLFVAALAIIPGTVAFIGVLLFAVALSSIGTTGIAFFARYDDRGTDHAVPIWNRPIASARS